MIGSGYNVGGCITLFWWWSFRSCCDEPRIACGTGELSWVRHWHGGERLVWHTMFPSGTQPA